jgi:hypothetical protein
MGSQGTLLSARHARVGSDSRSGGGQKDVVQILSASVDHFSGCTELSWANMIESSLFCIARRNASEQESRLYAGFLQSLWIRYLGIVRTEG